MTVPVVASTEPNQETVSYHSALTRVGTGAGIVIVGLLIGNGLDYLARIYVARTLGPAAYGVFELAYTIVMLAALISMLGMGTSVVRFVAQYTGTGEPAKAKAILVYGLTISLSFSLCALAIVWVANSEIAIELLKKPDLAFVLPVFALAIPLISTGSILLAALRGVTAMKQWSAAQNIVPNVFRLAAILILAGLFSGWLTVGSVIIIYVVGFLIRFILATVFVLRKPFMQRDIPVARGMASMLATASLPLLLSDIMSELRRNFEVLLLGYFASTADVGIFGAAVIIGQLINVPIMALERIFVPVAALLYARQQSHDVHKLYRTSARWILYSITPVLVAIILYSDTIVTSVLGVQYSAAAPVLQILAVGYFVNGLTGLWEQVLLAKGHNVVTMVLRIVWVVTSLVLAFILVPRYGYIGAAWSATIPLILIQLQGVYTVWWLEKAHPFSVQEFRYIAGTVLVFLIFYVLSQNVDVVRQHTAIFLPMACVVAYGVSLLFAGLTPDDRFLLSMLSSRLRKDQSLT